MPIHVRLAIAAAASVALSDAMRDPTIDQLQGPETHSPVIAYEAFRRTFGVERPHEDRTEYQNRVSLFETRSQQIAVHNARPDAGWVAVVNKFADYTDSEFKALLGHRHSRRARDGAVVASAVSGPSSFLQTDDDESLALSVDWSSNLTLLSRQAKDQGACGSCWAVAVAGVLEAHAEMAGMNVPEVSYEQLVDCVDNPKHCGGTGGCEGNTAELAFDYITKNGIGAMEDYRGGYKSFGHRLTSKCTPPQHAAVRVGGFVRLPENEARPLQMAVSKIGPVVVSADASDWMPYGSGVFESCGVNAVVNHAIMCMGYGRDTKLGKDYWYIRNSWGPKWGEGGYIRLLKHKDGESYCGIDNKPQDGVGCDGGPPTMPVCGMCGILSDSSYPTQVAVERHRSSRIF